MYFIQEHIKILYNRRDISIQEARFVDKSLPDGTELWGTSLKVKENGHLDRERPHTHTHHLVHKTYTTQEVPEEGYTKCGVRIREG